MSALLKVKTHASVNQQKVFWKSQTFPSLSWSKRPVMAIETDMVIVTVLAIKTDVAGNIVGASIIDTQPKGIRSSSGRKRWEHLWVI